MKKAIFNKRGTRQLIDSGWKEFDKQTNLITTGNAVLNTQHSSFIRPWSETECNGHTFPEGALMRSDLSTFRSVPLSILEIIEDKNRRDGVILYEFWTYDLKTARCKTFCWVVTDRNHKLLQKRIIVEYGTNRMKRISATEEILKYITE